MQFFRDAGEFLPILMSGVKLTIMVTLGSLAISTVLGLMWALMRVSNIPFLSRFSATAVYVLRGIPIDMAASIWPRSIAWIPARKFSAW